MREVPVSKIVGSVGRHRDFDRAFLPSKPDLSVRWRRIDEIMDKGEELPPVSLYKIGDAYFVQDGNHSVSVARQQGRRDDRRRGHRAAQQGARGLGDDGPRPAPQA